MATINFDRAQEMTLNTVGNNSRIAYRHTYNLWQQWCREREHAPETLDAENVIEFLKDQPVTRSSRDRHMAALKKMTRIMAAMDYSQFGSCYEMLKLIRVPDDGASQSTFKGRYLNVEEVRSILETWKNDERLTHIRNRAVLAVMFFTGMRRFEIQNMEWSHIDLYSGTLSVPMGKGEKPRTVAILQGREDSAIDRIKAWKDAQYEFFGTERRFVFCGLKNPAFLVEDKPMFIRAMNHIVEQTIDQCGISFEFHDARRTFGTELLKSGYQITDVQVQLGHSDPSTTIKHYSIPAEAQKRRETMKLAY